jgi:hypothetical protein
MFMAGLTCSYVGIMSIPQMSTDDQALAPLGRGGQRARGAAPPVTHGLERGRQPRQLFPAVISLASNICSTLTMDDMQTIGRTRHYVIVCHDGRRIDVDAESMWPSGFVASSSGATVEVIGPRHLCVRRIASSEVRQVERENGAIWST